MSNLDKSWSASPSQPVRLVQRRGRVLLESSVHLNQLVFIETIKLLTIEAVSVTNYVIFR